MVSGSSTLCRSSQEGSRGDGSFICIGSGSFCAGAICPCSPSIVIAIAVARYPASADRGGATCHGRFHLWNAGTDWTHAGAAAGLPILPLSAGQFKHRGGTPTGQNRYFRRWWSVMVKTTSSVDGRILPYGSTHGAESNTPIW